MLNVRLNDDDEKALERYCLDTGLSRSSVVKEALAVYLAQKRKEKPSYEAGADLFGAEGSGSADRSSTYKKKLKSKLHAKHTR